MITHCVKPRRVLGFFIYWFGFIMGMAFLFLQILMRTYSGRLTSFAVVSFVVMIHGLYVMSGSKLGLSLEFWREKFGAGHPLFFGIMIQFYIEAVLWIIFCILAVFFLAPTLIHKLFVLLIGNTVVCLLLYFRFKDRRRLT